MMGNINNQRQPSYVKDYLFLGSVSTAKYVPVLWLFSKYFLIIA